MRDWVRVTRRREDVVCRREVVLRIDCVSVSWFSRSRPLCVGRGVTSVSSEEDVSTGLAMAQRIRSYRMAVR